ncbi:MAG: hypothetical protein A2Z18_05325 [Armatimonadetes bacterium RBG_16_58_9]|nr:MAG: hypothetical protein A2Z18_05325 [Armatimonadetes bacterium RBG_16_58_9]
MIAGTAKIETTPATPVWMDGMIRAHESVGIHDPLYARAVFISPDENPANGYVIVSVDACGLDDAAASVIRTAAEAGTGVPSGHIIVAATHTHSGPATLGVFNDRESEYVAELSFTIVSAIKSAVSRAEPASAGCAHGREDTISHYRRLMTVDGRVVMNWEPHSPDLVVPLGRPDDQIGVLVVSRRADADDLMCLLFNHAGHPNVMSGENYLISADYPGMAASLIEEELRCTAMFINGAQGSVDIDGLRDRDWDGVARVGGALAEAAIAVAREAVPSENARIRGLHTEYTLASRKMTSRELAWAERVLAGTRGSVQSMPDGMSDDYKASFYKKLQELESTDVIVRQTCFAVDDTAFISFPGELFTEIGLRIKEESPFPQTCILGLANGYIGYVPTREAVSVGGYEVEARRVSEEAEQIVVERSLALLREVRES